MSLTAIRNRPPLRPPSVTVEESFGSDEDGWDLDTGDDWCPVCDLMWCETPERCAIQTAEILERYR